MSDFITKKIPTIEEVPMNMQQLLCNIKANLIEALERQAEENPPKSYGLASRYFAYTSQYLQYAIQLSGVGKSQKEGDKQ